jgi:protease YdgD
MRCRVRHVVARAAKIATGTALSALWLTPLLTALTASPAAALAASSPEQFRPILAQSLLHKVAVFGVDERSPLPQSAINVSGKIGVLHDAQSRSLCTAFCLAPNVVATAAHCLYRTGEEAPLRLSDISVRLNGSQAMSRVAGAGPESPWQNVLSGATHLNVKPPIDATHDWALLRLATPICKGTFGLSRRPVEEVMQLAKTGAVYNVAYHRDLPKWEPMISRGCDVDRNFPDAKWETIRRDFTDPEQLLLHTCDTGGASSGSPLLVDGPEGPEVVGINVGTYVQSKVIMLNGEVVHRFHSDDVANTGVNSQAFAAAFDAFTSPDLLASRNDIRRLQAALASRGFYSGVRDGRFGASTKISIENFERAAAMPVTGLATARLLRTVLGESRIETGRLPSETTASGTLQPAR